MNNAPRPTPSVSSSVPQLAPVPPKSPSSISAETSNASPRRTAFKATHNQSTYRRALQGNSKGDDQNTANSGAPAPLPYRHDYNDDISASSKGYTSPSGKGNTFSRFYARDAFETCASSCRSISGEEEDSSRDYVAPDQGFGPGKGLSPGTGKGTGSPTGAGTPSKGFVPGKGSNRPSKGLVPGTPSKGFVPGKGSNRPSKGLGAETSYRSIDGGRFLTVSKGSALQPVGAKGYGTFHPTKGGKGKGQTTTQSNECCKGGVSFLKVQLWGLKIGGTLSIGTANPCKENDAVHSSSPSLFSPAAKGGKGGKGSKSGSAPERVRFLDCSDPCLESFGEGCSISSTSMHVENGDDVCFGTWNSATGQFEFGKKMPLSVVLTLTSDIDGEEPSVTVLRTSCSKAVYPPYVAELNRSCESSSPFIASAVDDFVNATVVFKDGISPILHNEYTSSGSQSPFDYKFATCGCKCDEDNFTTLPPVLAPSSQPALPSSQPAPPSSQPAPPSPSPTFSLGTCNDLCEGWIASNCVIPGDEMMEERPCADESAGLRFLAASNEVDFKQSNYHKQMADLFQRLLAAGAFE